jgi:hypothetical protein
VGAGIPEQELLLGRKPLELGFSSEPSDKSQVQESSGTIVSAMAARIYRGIVSF